MKRHPEGIRGKEKRGDMTSQRFAWAVMYLNLPLWIAVIILAFAFGEWTTVRILVGANVILLLTSYIWLTCGEGLERYPEGARR